MSVDTAPPEQPPEPDPTTDGTVPPAPPADPLGASDDSNDRAEPDGPGREAAKYRRRLREVEAEREQLGERLAAYQRAAVEQLAGERLAVAADIFDVGRVHLADLVNEDGQVNADAVTAAVGELLASRPGLGKQRQVPVGFPSSGQGATNAAPSGRVDWGDVLRGE